MKDAVEVAAYLSDRSHAVAGSDFPTDPSAVARPGLYSWWVDEEGRGLLEASLGESLPSLIYAGQTGSTSSRSAKDSTATLRSRIVNNHLRGTAYGSTFRKSVSALLLEPMGLSVEKPDHLTRADNDRVSRWMRDHLSVVVYPIDDRAGLGSFEKQVLAILDPPLNLKGMAPTAIRRRLSTLRRQLTNPDPFPASDAPGGATEVAASLQFDESIELGELRFMVPTGGPDDWRRLLADPELHWKVGRSARTMAHAWEDAGGWPPEISKALAGVPALARLRPVYGFPEFKTPLPGGSRASQTDLMVIATDGDVLATVAIEGKVDETFGEFVGDWLGPEPSAGKRRRLRYLCELLGIREEAPSKIRYQLLHRAAAARLEASRNGSRISVMLVHSWGPRLEGFGDFEQFAHLLGVELEPGAVVHSESADLWIGWMSGNPEYLTR